MCSCKLHLDYVFYSGILVILRLEEAKKLAKKYKFLKTEIGDLITSLESEPIQGAPLGNDCYKIRLAIKSKRKGKSGGARIITCVKILGNTVYLLSIYNKSVKENITNKELLELIKNIGL